MDIPEKITDEYLQSLPLIHHTLSGIPVTFRYDEKLGKGYLLNNNGGFEGRTLPIPPGTIALGEGIIRKQQQEQPPVRLPANTSTAESDHQPEPSVNMPPLETDDYKSTDTQAATTEQEYAATETEEDMLVEELTEEDLDEVFGEEEEEKEKGKKNIKPLVLALVAAAVIFVLITAVQTIRLLNEGETPDSPQTTATTPSDKSNETTEAEPSTEASTLGTELESTAESATTQSEETQPKTVVRVVTVANTLIPGDVLTEDDFTIVEMEESRYWTLAALGGIYTEEDIPALIGMVPVKYLPSGSYLYFDHVSHTYQPINPWGTTEQQPEWFLLNVTPSPELLDAMLFGVRADVTLTIHAKISTPADTETEGDVESGPPAGVEHNSSTVESMKVDTYVIQGATIIDALAADNSSLFEEYQKYATIPAAFQKGIMEKELASLDDMAALVPAQIKIAVTTEQAIVLRTLATEDAQISLSNMEDAADNLLQKETREGILPIIQLIASRWETLLQEGV